MRKSTQGNWSLQKRNVAWSKNRNYSHSLRILNWGSALSSPLNCPIKVKSPKIKGGKEPGMKERLLKASFSRVSPEITRPNNSTKTEISEKLTAGLSIICLDRPASRETWRAAGCNKPYSVRLDVQDRCCLHVFGFISVQRRCRVWKASSKSQNKKRRRNHNIYKPDMKHFMTPWHAEPSKTSASSVGFLNQRICFCWKQTVTLSCSKMPNVAKTIKNERFYVENDV